MNLCMPQIPITALSSRAPLQPIQAVCFLQEHHRCGCVKSVCPKVLPRDWKTSVLSSLQQIRTKSVLRPRGCYWWPFLSHRGHLHLLNVQPRRVLMLRLQLFPAANLYFFCLTPFSASKCCFLHLFIFFRIVSAFFFHLQFFDCIETFRKSI